MQSNLVIQIENGVPINHPILVENFIQAFPGVDLNNLPGNYAWFERVPRPNLGFFEKNQTSTYEFVDGVVKDVWHSEPMTEEEKQTKRTQTTQGWYASTGWNSWTLNETTGEFEPPIPYPNDGKLYRWVEASLNWIEVTD